jgi:hypothetical protein
LNLVAHVLLLVFASAFGSPLSLAFVGILYGPGRPKPKKCDFAGLVPRHGRDFLKAEGRWDWAVGNPPFSQFRAFLQQAMQVADNVVFITLAPAWFVRARQEDSGRRGSPWWNSAPCPSRRTGPSSASN